MSKYYGSRAQDSTLIARFSTNAADGGAEGFSATVEVADFDIYAGTSATQRASTAGFAIAEDFDSSTSLHVFSADLSDNTDAGFYAAGSNFGVAFTPDETVDSQTIEGWIAEFDLESNAGQANRLLGEAIYPSGVTISTTTGNTNTPNSRINLTDVHDAQTADADLVGARYLVLDQGTGQAVEAIAYSVQSARLFNFRTAAAGEDLDFIVAAGDYVIFLGHGIVTRIDAAEDGSVLTEAGGNGDHLTEAGGDGDHLTEAGGDGDHLTEAGGTGDHLTAVSLASLDEAALQQIVDDLENGGRLDLLIDAIKAKTDSLTFTVTNQVDANAKSINDVTVIGVGTAGNKWRA